MHSPWKLAVPQQCLAILEYGYPIESLRMLYEITTQMVAAITKPLLGLLDGLHWCARNEDMFDQQLGRAYAISGATKTGKANEHASLNSLAPLWTLWLARKTLW